MDGTTTNRKFFMDDDIEQEEIPRSKNFSLLINKLSLLCLTTFYFGYCLVYISALSPTTLSNIFGSVTRTPFVKGFLIGSLTIGAMFGSFISIYLIPLFARRKLTFILCIFALVIQGVIQIPNIFALFVCRTLQGIIVGIFMALVPTYIGELAPKQLVKKGNFGVFSTLFVIIGVMFAFSLSIVLFISEMDQQIKWRVILAVNVVAIGIVALCIMLGLIPESPNSLIQMGKEDQAKSVIALFHKKKHIEQVYRQKVKQVQKKRVNEQQAVKDKVGLRNFLAFQIPMMQQLTGINAFVSQMGFVVTASNVSFGERFGVFVPVIMGIVQFIAAIYSMTCLYKTKRRTMILIGNLGMGLCSLGIGILFEFIQTFRAGFWIVVFLTFVYMTIHGGTLIPAVWVYVAQISQGRQPQYSSVTNWFMCSVTIVVFPIINETYGYDAMFLTFGVISIILFLINYFIMLETKSKTVEQINIELRSS